MILKILSATYIVKSEIKSCQTACVFSIEIVCPQPMASFLNSDDEDYDLLNNQNNNLFENRVLFENQTQTTLLNYYDATIKTVCYFLSLLKTASNVLDFSKYLEFCIF